MSESNPPLLEVLPEGREISCAVRLKVLADETRLAVLRHLLAGPKLVSEMNQHLGVEQSLLSHHLKTLREAGLVVSERDGKGVKYSLAPGVEMSPNTQSINLGCCSLSFDLRTD